MVARVAREAMVVDVGVTKAKVAEARAVGVKVVREVVGGDKVVARTVVHVGAVEARVVSEGGKAVEKAEAKAA